MIKLQKAKINITSKVANRSTQSRKYYERSIDFDDLSFDKITKECNVLLPTQERIRLENFFKEFQCEEYYFEVPTGKLYFTSKAWKQIDNTIIFQVFKEEKIAYPEKEKV